MVSWCYGVTVNCSSIWGQDLNFETDQVLRLPPHWLRCAALWPGRRGLRVPGLAFLYLCLFFPATYSYTLKMEAVSCSETQIHFFVLELYVSGRSVEYYYLSAVWGQLCSVSVVYPIVVSPRLLNAFVLGNEWQPKKQVGFKTQFFPRTGKGSVSWAQPEPEYQQCRR